MCKVNRNDFFENKYFVVSLLWFPITTPCGHVFCRECLIRSVDNTQIQCPICKDSLDEVRLRFVRFVEMFSFLLLVFSNVNTISCKSN